MKSALDCEGFQMPARGVPTIVFSSGQAALMTMLRAGFLSNAALIG